MEEQFVSTHDMGDGKYREKKLLQGGWSVGKWFLKKMSKFSTGDIFVGFELDFFIFEAWHFFP